MTRRLWLLGVVVAAVCARPAAAEVLGRCGRGYLERVDGHLVLHVKGTPYEMGYQHGVLLRDHARALVHHLFEVKAKEKKLKYFGVELEPKELVKSINGYQRPYTPARFLEEMRGVADGSGIPLADVEAANSIPELFHCSGFALLAPLTADGTLLHGRVLDYSTDWKLQEHAVVVLAEPDGRVPFANVTYAGFVGSVTGMNREQISIGEMGGRGLGKWAGTPMAFLMRRVLEEAKTLDEATAVFKNSKRTCEYYFVVGDGRANRAVGMEAGADRFELVQPGAKHKLLPTPVPDAVLLSAGKRYDALCGLVRAVRDARGKFTTEQAVRLMDAPVAMKSNLHNVLMAPGRGELWVAHAAADGKPAWTQKYHHINAGALWGKPPAAGGTVYPAPPSTPPAVAAVRP